jgi:methionyl aminopeptidase
MKLYNYKEPFSSNGFFKLKDKNWLEKQRVAGKTVAMTLTMLQNLVKEKTSLTTLELSRLAEEFILKQKCTPTFKNYKGFPEAVCISVNHELVHGIPKDYRLQEGDVVKFDLGATFENVIADSAITCIYGEPKDPNHVKLVKCGEEALMKGIASIKVGEMLGVIGNTIYKSAKGNGFSVITSYGGHGICNHADGSGMPHAPPFVSNKSNPGDGFRIQPGLTLAIEPMLVPRDVNTRVLNDNWTVVTREIGCHWEHSVFVHEDYVEIITAR